MEAAAAPTRGPTQKTWGKGKEKNQVSKNQTEFGGEEPGSLKSIAGGLCSFLPCVPWEQQAEASSALAITVDLNSHPLLLCLSISNHPLPSFLLC